MTYILIFRYHGGAPPENVRVPGDGKPSISFFVECRGEAEYAERKANLAEGGYIVFEMYGAEEKDGIPRKWREKESFAIGQPAKPKPAKRAHLAHLRQHKT